MKLQRALQIVICAAALAFASGRAFARAQESTPTLEAARQRWERLSPEEKERMKERYEQYRALPETERRALAERARRLQEQGKLVQEELPQDVREKIRMLDPEKRREVVKDLLDEAAREKGARIRGKMPEAWIERLESAKPEERAHILAEFQRKARERLKQGQIDKIGRYLQMSADEIERLKMMPEPERAHATLELTKRLPKREAEEFGLPPGMTAEQWDALERLSPEKFFEEIQHWAEIQRVRREQAARKLDAPEDAAEHERMHHLKQLSEALHARPEEVIALAELPGAERQVRLARMRRERVLQVIRNGRLLAPERIQELERLPEPQFLRAARELLPVQPGALRARRQAESPQAKPPNPIEREHRLR